MGYLENGRRERLSADGAVESVGIQIKLALQTIQPLHSRHVQMLLQAHQRSAINNQASNTLSLENNVIMN